MLQTVHSGGAINWGAKGPALVAQNVQNLLATYWYEVAYNRLLGLNPAFIDRPGSMVMAELQMQVKELIARFEPRAVVQTVSVSNNGGDMEIEVVIAI